jgi:hypothetical protein
MTTLSIGLKPLTAPAASAQAQDGAGHEAARITGAGLSAVKIAVLVILLAVLVYLGARRVREGMLTWETGMLAAESLLRFAVLPFVITWLIIRARRFRRAAFLD